MKIRLMMAVAFLAAALVAWPFARQTPCRADAPAPAADPYQGILSYEAGQSRASLLAIEQEIRDAKPEARAAIETKLLAALKNPKATEACKVFVCRVLARGVGSTACVPAMSELLTDAKLAHAGRNVLEAVADPSAADALRAAMKSVQGPLLVGVIGSLAHKHDAAAVPAIAELMSNSDATIAGAAIGALGQIATVEAAAALDASKSKVAEPLRPAVIDAQLACAARLACAGNSAAAAKIYEALADAKQSKIVRLTANAGLLAGMNPADMNKTIVQWLGSDDEALRAAALASLSAGSSLELQSAAAEQVFSLKPAVQPQVLAILVDQPQIKLRPTLLRIIKESQAADVRGIALDAMVKFAEAADAPLLAQIAGAEKGDDSSAARKVLEQSAASGMNEALVQLTAAGEKASRLAAVRALVIRNPQDLLDVLSRLADDKEPDLRREAIRAIGEAGGMAQLPLLAKAAQTAEDSIRGTIQSAAQKICSRASDKPACSAIMLPSLAQAGSNANRAAILQILPQIGDDASLAAVTKALQAAETEIRDAAVRALADWTNASAAPALLEIAKSSTNQTHVVLALRGYVRLAGIAKDRPIADRLEMCRNALDLAKRPEEKRLVVAGLVDLPCAQSLDWVLTCMKDKTLRDDAALAGIRIATVLSSTDATKARAALEQIKAATTRDDLRKQADEALSAANELVGCITAWMIAGPFTVNGKDGSALYDLPLGPEKGAAERVEWKSMPPAANPKEQWQINLLKMFNGSNRVAYAATTITSPKDQTLTLELGSDDGNKVFLNGKEIYGKNVVRPMRPGDDKVKLELKKGDNVLLVKIIQVAGDWGFCARLRTQKNQPPEGLILTPGGK